MPGQVHMILFWSPWVTKSHKMVSFTQRAMYLNKNKWKDQVKVSAISIKTTHEIVPQLIEAKKWDLINHYYRDTSNCFESYGINSVPLVIIIDKEGVIAYKGPGFKDYQEIERCVQIMLNGEKMKHQIERVKKQAIEREKRENR